MLAKFGVTSKKINSTSRKITVIFEADIVLKESTSIVTPVFKILGGRFPIYNDEGEITGWNEIEPVNFDKVKNVNYVEYLGAYYWVNDIISENNWVSEFVCSRDVLATFLPNIQRTSAYIKYGPWELTDKKGYLDDKRLSPDLECDEIPDIYLDTDLIDFSTTGDDFTVIWTVNSLGYAKEAYLDYGTVTLCCSFKNYLKCCLEWSKAYGSDGSETSLTDVGQFLYKMTSGTFAENVYSAKLYPISYKNLVNNINYKNYFTDFKGTVGPYSILNTDESVTDFEIKRVQSINPLFSDRKKDGTVAKINLPIAEPNTPFSRYNFLKGEKYNEILVMTPAGIKNISSNKFIKHESTADIFYEYYFDLYSGDMTLALKEFGKDSGDIYSVSTWNFGVDVINFASSGEGEGRIARNQIGAFTAGVGAASVAAGSLTAIAAGVSSTVGKASVLASRHIPATENNLDRLVALEARGLKATKTADNYLSTHSVSTASVMAMGTGIGTIMSNGGNRSQSQTQAYADGIIGLWTTMWRWSSEQFLAPARIYIKTYIPSVMNSDYSEGEDDYEQFCNHFGYPVEKYAFIGDEIKGYYECANFNVVCGTEENEALTGNAMTLQEASSINSLLNSGVYIED